VKAHHRTATVAALTLLLATPCWLAAAPTTAQAQDDETARARALFEEGVEFADQARWQEAADRFEQTLRIRSTAVVGYNLALALVNLGRLVEAQRYLEQIGHERTVDRRLRRDARRALADLTPRIGALTIHLDGDLAGVEVRVGSREIPADRIGAEIAADPGRQVVVATLHGREVDRAEVTIRQGAPAEVTLHVVPTAEQAARAGIEEETPGLVDEGGTDSGSGSILGKWWLWAGVGAVVVGAIVVTLLVSSGGTPDPVSGNLSPAVLGVEVMP